RLLYQYLNETNNFWFVEKTSIIQQNIKQHFTRIMQRKPETCTPFINNQKLSRLIGFPFVKHPRNPEPPLFHLNPLPNLPTIRILKQKTKKKKTTMTTRRMRKKKKKKRRRKKKRKKGRKTTTLQGMGFQGV
ncbi:MAG: hypothetical protein Q8889_02655, partial [Candidatus Phytoplasma australasiaticum]|nr:hypothetical protein [Candidatus Phytoplasma australasiaticum]